MEAADLARACAMKMIEGDEVRRALGIEIASVAPGAAVATMLVRRDMLNSREMCHGGVIFSLADTAFAYACNSHDVATVAQNCSIAFLAPARLGDVLTATAREAALAGRSGVYDVAVRRQDGSPIAEFQGLSRSIGGSVLAEGRRAAKD
ncbi:MAG: hydroxyphenylacetyl-CoA thioesterase PaaI [Hyphomicrobiales bacterium]|nr:hydroxyphenylacetyl-CoA thioesterase PaaI [Hyphomicrobiales bacterium]